MFKIIALIGAIAGGATYGLYAHTDLFGGKCNGNCPLMGKKPCCSEEPKATSACCGRRARSARRAATAAQSVKWTVRPAAEEPRTPLALSVACSFPPYRTKNPTRPSAPNCARSVQRSARPAPSAASKPSGTLARKSVKPAPACVWFAPNCVRPNRRSRPTLASCARNCARTASRCARSPMPCVARIARRYARNARRRAKTPGSSRNQ